MKVNKVTFIVCFFAVILSGAFMILVGILAPQRPLYTVIQGIATGIFTGFFVSFVISIIGYFHEKNLLIEKADYNIRGLYVNMEVLSRTIGAVLSQIYYLEDLASLPFDRISTSAKLNVDFINDMNLGLFSPLHKYGKLAQVYLQLKNFQHVAYNTKNIAQNLQIQVLEYCNKLLQTRTNEAQGIPPAPGAMQQLGEMKNHIIVRTSKFHEYVTGQTYNFANIAETFYFSKGGKKLWETIEPNLKSQIEDIMKA